LSGYAHFGQHLNAQYGLSIDLPAGYLGILQVLEGGNANYSVWYDILNGGFRMTPVAGTDYPSLPSIPGREHNRAAPDEEAEFVACSDETLAENNSHYEGRCSPED
jgi:hypothetical protein